MAIMKRLLEAICLVALLVVLAWIEQRLAVPAAMGFLRDDAWYAVYADALAHGQGYVNPALPDHPPAARFPIGFPALLMPLLIGVTVPPVQVIPVLLQPVGSVRVMS